MIQLLLTQIAKLKKAVSSINSNIANIAQGEAIIFTIASGVSSLFSLKTNASRKYGNLGVYSLRVHTLATVSAGERQLGSVNRSPSGACCGAIILTSNTSQVGTFNIANSNVWINLTTQVADGSDLILSASCDCST